MSASDLLAQVFRPKTNFFTFMLKLKLYYKVRIVRLILTGMWLLPRLPINCDEAQTQADLFR